MVPARLPAPERGYTTGVEARAAAGIIGGRYRISGLLGEGGMARVFDAFDDRLERSVAVKILRPEIESLPGMRTRFQQEARIAARLVHPNIVAVLDFGEDGSTSYLVMERLPGTTLRDEIVHGPLALPRVRFVIAEALAALAAAHARGVLHRDIKPSNILLQGDGHTKIADFGIAKSFDTHSLAHPVSDDLTLTGVVLGTPGYLAPERRTGGSATVQSDLFAVGAMMVEAVTGRRAVPGGRGAEDLPPPLRDVACRALAVDPHDRFPSARAMWQALGSSETAPRPARPLPGTPATATGPIAPPPTPAVTAVQRRPGPVPPGEPRRRRRRRSRALVVAACAAAATLVAAVVLLAHHGGPPSVPAASATSHNVALAQSKRSDTEGAAISAVATSLAGGDLPGDGAMAHALDTTAAQRPGPNRQASAEQALSLAGVLLSGGGITPGQYLDVVNVLQPTGATVPTTTVPSTTVPSTTVPTAPAPSPLGFLFGGHHHDHGGGPGGTG